MNRGRRLLGALTGALLCSVSACDDGKSVGFDEPANVAGKYSVTITGGKNGCNLDGWKEGDRHTDIPLMVTQTGADITASVGGLAAIVLGLSYGSADYVGGVVGNKLTVTLYGKHTRRTGECVHTMNSVVRAELVGDFLRGTISHEPSAGNGHPDCMAIKCSSEQHFNGSRPPTVPMSTPAQK
jgi:hypothetical protein